MMLAHSVAAGAHAATVSSRKPLVVRAQAVSEVATNGSSTATAPPPRAKASCTIRRLGGFSWLMADRNGYDPWLRKLPGCQTASK
jgi:hypothetical protein